jgi:hypothetical protein
MKTVHLAAIALGAVPFGALACGNAGPQAPESTRDNLQTAGSTTEKLTVAKGETVVAASEQTQQALGVAQWVVLTVPGGQAIVGVDSAGAHLMQVRFRPGSSQDAPHAITWTDLKTKSTGSLLLMPDATVVQNTLPAAAVLAGKLLDGDLRAQNQDGALDKVVAYDACSVAREYTVACAVAVAVACLSVETGVGIAACAAAVGLLAQANDAERQACSPQYCFADWQCSDAYGPGWVCGAGGCVSESISYPGSGESGGGGGGGEDQCTDLMFCMANAECGVCS